MKLEFGNEILSSYKRLSYTTWFAIAEFVDNSTQSYINNKAEMDILFEKEKTNLCVDINYDSSNGQGNEVLTITDNSIGMNDQDLQNALTIGQPPLIKDGRSRYGLGLKTAAFWFGNTWSIKTKKAGSEDVIFVEVDLNKIIDDKNTTLTTSVTKGDVNQHYTIIKITSLNRKLRGRTLAKTKEYLSSIYRFDFEDMKLNLTFQGEKITWDSKRIIDRLIKDENKNPLMREFDFTVGDKKVFGWAGVFEKGSRKDAGFSIIQAKRVIKGWPDSYKPEKIYGYQEGGSNNLISQRLVGELNLEGFDVSHTKDTILFRDDDEEDILQNMLIEKIGDFIKTANEFRRYESDEDAPDGNDIAITIAEILDEINSGEFKEIVANEVLPEEVIVASNTMVAEKVKTQSKPKIEAQIGKLKVIVYLNDEASPYDPYLITRSTVSENEVIIIINKLHPHWATLKSNENLYNYVRHCVYDGVSEWKAYFKSNTINPDTIKNIKDQLLRIPFEMEKKNIKK